MLAKGLTKTTLETWNMFFKSAMFPHSHMLPRAQHARSKMFKHCLKGPNHTQQPTRPTRPKVVMKFMGILPIEIWTSKWCDLFAGKTSKSFPNKCQQVDVGQVELSIFTWPMFVIFKSESTSLLCLQIPCPKPKVQLVSKNQIFVSCHIYHPMIAHHLSFPNHEWVLMAGWQQTSLHVLHRTS